MAILVDFVLELSRSDRAQEKTYCFPFSFAFRLFLYAICFFLLLLLSFHLPSSSVPFVIWSQTSALKRQIKRQKPWISNRPHLMSCVRMKKYYFWIIIRLLLYIHPFLVVRSRTQEHSRPETITTHCCWTEKTKPSTKAKGEKNTTQKPSFRKW